MMLTVAAAAASVRVGLSAARLGSEKNAHFFLSGWLVDNFPTVIVGIAFFV